MGVREGEVDEEVGLGLEEQVGHAREARLAGDRPPLAAAGPRADASSGCSKTDRMTVATMLRAERGTRFSCCA